MILNEQGDSAGAVRQMREAYRLTEDPRIQANLTAILNNPGKQLPCETETFDTGQ